MRSRATQFLLSVLLLLHSLVASARLTTPPLPDFSGHDLAPLSVAADLAESAMLAAIGDRDTDEVDADIFQVIVLVFSDEPEKGYVGIVDRSNNGAIWILYEGKLPLGLEGILALEVDSEGEQYGFAFGTTAWIEYLPAQDRQLNFEGGTSVKLKEFRIFHVHNYGNDNGPEPWRRERGKDGKWRAVPGPDGEWKGRLGVNYAPGLDAPCTHRRSMWIDDAAEKRLFEFFEKQRRMGSASWTLNQNCAWFAAEAWRIATGENIDPGHGKVVTDIVPAEEVEGFLRDQGVPEILGKMMAKGADMIPCPCPAYLAEGIEDKNGGEKKLSVPRVGQP